MADKRIQDLTPASQVQTADRFVLEQSGQAKSLTGQILINDLATYLDGHGGINDIAYTAPSSGELDGTLTITLADETVETFTVTNGRGIYNIAKTDTQGLVDEYTIFYNDDTTSTFSVTNGEKGETGDNWYVHIKWSATEPTQDSDMSDTPNNWIGIYSGIGSTAPTSYSSYTWFEYKGETGDTGNGISSISIYSSSGTVDTYQVLFTNGTTTTFTVTNGSSISSITKTSTVGLVDTYTVTLTNGDSTTFTVTNAKSITTITPPGNPGLPGNTDTYTINYNNGDTSYFYVYNGTNGTGSVSTVDDIDPISGDVSLLQFGSGSPTVETPGSVKSRYFDTLNNQLYICVDADTEHTPNTFTWRGSSVTVDSTLSTTSTNPVQNAVLTALLGTAPLITTAQTLTEAVNELKAEQSGFADNIADPYDATATYAVGDLCIHDNTLYRCNTAIITAEVWNSIHWTQCTVDDELVTIESSVSGINSTIGNTALPTTAQTLTGAIAEIDGDVSGKVSKSGDTMTGNLRITDDRRLIMQETAKAIGDTISSDTNYNEFAFRDKNDSNYAMFSGRFTASGNVGIRLAATRSGNYNVLSLLIDSSGNPVIQLGTGGGQAWRKAIGLGQSDGSFPLTISQGGTGMTAVTTASGTSVITAGSGISVTSAQYRAWGKIAQITLNVKKSTAIAANTWTNLGSLVSGKYPVVEVSGTLEAPCVTANVRITTSTSSGAIDIRSATQIAANTAIAITAVYFLA